MLFALVSQNNTATVSPSLSILSKYSKSNKIITMNIAILVTISIEIFRVGFPVMIGSMIIATIYLLTAHVIFAWH